MKRVELRTEVKEVLLGVFGETKVTLDMAEQVISGIEGIIRGVQEQMDEKESVKFADANFGSKFVKERSGVTKLGGEEKAWTKEAHWEGCVKATKPMKEL